MTRLWSWGLESQEGLTTQARIESQQFRIWPLVSVPHHSTLLALSLDPLAFPELQSGA